MLLQQLQNNIKNIYIFNPDKVFLSGSKISVTSDETILSETISDLFDDVVTQLNEYFQGNRTDFQFKMNPIGTDFQKKVWEELLKIPFGKTVSYQEVTNNLGDPKAIRAVANANSKNPLWIVILCHRVIGSDGSLTGYAGGLWRKKWLLDHENPVKQQSLF